LAEELRWAHDHGGPQWVGRVVLTKDKTLVRVEVLIDDKPEVTGAPAPAWEGLVFGAPTKSAPRGGASTGEIGIRSWPK
jgi:5'-nucleotidase